MQTLMTGWQLLRALTRQAGPYLVIELLLPGGTLFAFILFLARSGAFSALQPTPAGCLLYAQCEVSQTLGERCALRGGATVRGPALA